MAKRYSDAIRIRETKSAYNIQTEESNEWKNFIPNEQFNEILQKVIGSVSNKIVDEHRSFPVFVIGTPKFQDWVAISIKS